MDAADIASDLQELSVTTRVSKITLAQQSQGASECDECGNAIPAARREAAPWATHCISCQELIEQRSRHMRRA